MTRTPETLVVQHDLAPDEISDAIALLLAAELDDAGLLDGQQEFEQVFIGIVASTGDGRSPQWLPFYRNSLAGLEAGTAAFAPIHAHAESLLIGSRIVDLGSCFGFFPLRLAARGFDVVGTDLSAPTMALLAGISTALRRRLTTLCCNATRVPLPRGTADTVTVLHLLEHLTADVADAVIAEALRLTYRRVVIAVPFEDEPRTCYGHIQRFDDGRLRALADRARAAHPGLRAAVHEFHGGWLILDR